MSDPSGKTVAVIDPLWVGHHPMYFVQFVAAFLRQGVHVIGLCPDPEDARRELLEIDPLASEKITLRKLAIRSRSFFGGRFEGDPIRTTHRWREANAVLENAEKESGRSADFVYFPYLDSYLRFLPVPLIPEIILGRPWSGLYLRNHHFGNAASLKNSLVHLAKGDPLLRSKSCLGIGVLDERFIPQMESHTGKTVRLFPDFTHTDLPESPTPLARQVIEEAAGRKIIGIIGLERRKGILTLLKTAVLARERQLPYYFVCGGKIFPSEFSQQEWQWIESLAGGRLENLHLDLAAGRIPTETGFNSLFATFDIAWAAYENFQGSSNTLGKAAAFEIPCLASEGGCIAHRVTTFRTGLTIPQGDAAQALATFPKLLADHPTARFADFREQHSLTRLDTLLQDLLSKIRKSV